MVFCRTVPDSANCMNAFSAVSKKRAKLVLCFMFASVAEDAEFVVGSFLGDLTFVSQPEKAMQISSNEIVELRLIIFMDAWLSR